MLALCTTVLFGIGAIGSPVGDAPDCANKHRKRHVVVGTTKRGVNGLYDMGADVWERVADWRGDEALTAGGSWLARFGFRASRRGVAGS